MSRFAYPFYWVYSVLNAADYFRRASLFDRSRPDPRMADAVELIRAAREPNGMWLQGGRHPGRVWLEVDVQPGEPSKWLTLFATESSRGGTPTEICSDRVSRVHQNYSWTTVFAAALGSIRTAERWFLDRGLPSVLTTRGRLWALLVPWVIQMVVTNPPSMR